jgi:hypothetical protein
MSHTIRVPHKDPEKKRQYLQRWQELHSEEQRAKQRAKDKARLAILNAQGLTWRGTPKIAKLSEGELRARRKERCRKNYERDRGTIKDQARTHRIKSYGWIPEAVSQVLHEQQGTCAICGILLEGHPQSLTRANLDHCHLERRARGILCGACNRALGLFRDSEFALSNAIEYLRKYQ